MTKPNDKSAKTKAAKKTDKRDAEERTGSMDVSRLLDKAMIDAAKGDDDFTEEPPSSITGVLDQVVEDFKKEQETGHKRRKR